MSHRSAGSSSHADHLTADPGYVGATRATRRRGLERLVSKGAPGGAASDGRTTPRTVQPRIAARENQTTKRQERGLYGSAPQRTSAGERTKGVTWVAPRWSLSSARIDTSSGGSPPHLPRRCWCAKVLVRIQGVCTRGYVYADGRVCVYTDERSVPAPPNGRGRRECWRAATRRLRRCRGSSSLPLRPRLPRAVGELAGRADRRCARDGEGNTTRRTYDERGRSCLLAPFHELQRAIMSARSPDWRSGANPRRVALDAFSDVLRPSRALCASTGRLSYPHHAPSSARRFERSSLVLSLCRYSPPRCA